MGNKNIVHFVKTLPSLNRCCAENTAPRGFFSIMLSYKTQHADKKCIFVLSKTFDTLGIHSVQPFLDVCFGCFDKLEWICMQRISLENTSLPQRRDISKKSHTEPEDTQHSSATRPPQTPTREQNLAVM